MTDQDLLDRMARSTEWTAGLTTDPAADLARGRSRLLRRRIGVAAATASVTVVAVVGASVVPDRLTDRAGEAVVAARTGPPSAARPMPARPSADAAAATRKAVARANLETLIRRVDPHRTHVARALPGWSQGTTLGGAGGWSEGTLHDRTGTEVPMLEAHVPWSQGGGYGSARVRILDSSLVDTAHHSFLDNRSDRCVRAARKTAPPKPAYTSCSFTTVGGKRVLVGIVGSAPWAYYASFVQPDGDLVVAEIDGYSLTENRPEAFPGARPPVERPSVEVADLVAAVTDEALVLPR